MQRIFVIGGSNSLMKNGWVSKLKTDFSDRVEIVNLSIGAATSLMAIYRILSGQIPDGSTVVWEYAINESNHFKNGQSVSSLLYGVDWLLTLCARRSIRFIPLIFWTREQAAKGEPGAYYGGLFSLLSSRGLAPVDFGEIAQRMAQSRGVDIYDLYSDGLHYSVSEEIIDSICTLVLKNIAASNVPDASQNFDGRDLRVVFPESGRVEAFKSGVFAGDYCPFHDEIIIPAKGMLLAAYVVASQNGGGITLKVDGNTKKAYSLMTPRREKPPFRLVKHLVFELDGDFGIPVESTVSVSRFRNSERPIVQNTFDWYPAKDMPKEKDDGFIAALLEV